MICISLLLPLTYLLNKKPVHTIVLHAQFLSPKKVRFVQNQSINFHNSLFVRFCDTMKKNQTVYNSIRLWYMFKTIIVYVWGRLCDKKQWYFMKCDGFCHILWNQTTIQYGRFIERKKAFYVVVFVISDNLSMWKILWYRTTYLCVTVCDMRHLIYVVQFVIWDILSMWYSLWYQTTYLCGTVCDIRHLMYVVHFVISDKF